MIDANRNQIVAEAFNDAERLSPSKRPNSPPESARTELGDAAGNTNSQLVKDAQTLLTALGYSPGPVDGQWGPQTANAVRSFQRKAGQFADGVINADLLKSLRKAYDQIYR